MAEQLSKEVQDFYKDVKALSKSYKSISTAEFVKSGSVVFDAILGGGIPKGVFISWAAEEGCGKSTGALHISKAYCVQGKRVIYLDYEGGVNSSQIDGIGLKDFLYSEDNPTGTFMLFKCQTYKDAETILDKLMTSVDLVIIDSTTAMLTEKVKGSSSEDVLPGQDARVASIFLKKYKAEAVRNDVTWIMINQLRTKISFMAGSGEVPSGGLAMRFYPDILLSMKSKFKGSIEREEVTSNGKQKVPYGKICTIKATKNRYERPNIPLDIAIIFGQGIENSYAYYDFLCNQGCIKQTGAWYTVSFGNYSEKLNGQNKVIEFISGHKQEVKDYINSCGGYRLLLNKNNAIDLDGSEESEEIYNSSVIEDFDNIVDPSEESDSEE